MSNIQSSSPIEPQPTGVPVDARDPNHPHFPGDIESQPDRSRVSLLHKKAVFIAVVILMVTTFVLAAIIGLKTAPKHYYSVANMTTETVYVGTTVVTTVSLTSAVTNKTTMTATNSVSSKATPEPGDPFRCFVFGAWKTKSDCENECRATASLDQIPNCMEDNGLFGCTICQR